MLRDFVFSHIFKLFNPTASIHIYYNYTAHMPRLLLLWLVHCQQNFKRRILFIACWWSILNKIYGYKAVRSIVCCPPFFINGLPYNCWTRRKNGIIKYDIVTNIKTRRERNKKTKMKNDGTVWVHTFSIGYQWRFKLLLNKSVTY